ncbi:hypothetical protein [Actinocorallia aurea]
MALNEEYRTDNPIRSIQLRQSPSKPILVADHEQWRRFEEALTYPPARLFARLNVTTWARRCEMIGFRPCDFDFPKQTLTISRSTVYITARFHPTGEPGRLHKPHPKNSDWRRFAISKQMCTALQDHIDEYDLAPTDLLFPHWMFTYHRITDPTPQEEGETLAPLLSASEITYAHGTKTAYYGLKCRRHQCRQYAAEYQREWLRRRADQRQAAGNPIRTKRWTRDNTECLGHEVWDRFWHQARQAAGLPQGFTPYNARHTGISWAIDKGIDLQKFANEPATAASPSPAATPPSSTNTTPPSPTPSKKSSPTTASDPPPRLSAVSAGSPKPEILPPSRQPKITCHLSTARGEDQS